MDYMRKLQQPQNTKHWRLLKQLGDHMTCQYNHFLINSKNDCTKRSHIILKCLKTSLLIDYRNQQIFQMNTNS